MKLRVACATDNEQTLIDRHFGDAEKYAIYDLGADKLEEVKTIMNTTEEDDEDVHADPKKANSVKDLLQQEEVEVITSQEFGPNVVRVKKHFVPVVMGQVQIDEVLAVMQEHFEEIKKQWKHGQGREHLVFK